MRRGSARRACGAEESRKHGARLVIFDYAIGGSPNETDLSVEATGFYSSSDPS